MADDPTIPEGYEYQWLPDDRWVIGGAGKRCRMKKCTNEAVARLMRSAYYRGVERVRLWAYCSEHLYGRRIEGDKILVETLRAKECGNE